jgi:hypothetical protein
MRNSLKYKALKQEFIFYCWIKYESFHLIGVGGGISERLVKI